MTAVAPMRVAILGAGAMGSLVGACLSDAGADTTLLDVNEAHLDAIRRDGLHITTDSGERIVRLAACRPDALAVSPDLLVVLTKQPHTAAALASVRPRLSPRCWVLTLQNGLGNQELIARALSPAQIMLGVTTYPADLNGPGHVSSHGAGLVRLMSADGVHRPIQDEVAALFVAGGMACVVDPAVAVAIWAKVAFNAALNSICGVTGALVGQVAAVPEASRLALDVAAEVVAVANAAGIPVDGSEVRVAIEDAMVQHAAHKPSMLQDLLAGRLTEIGSINGAVVEIADRIGQPVPLTRALLALVRVVEGRAR